MGLNTNERQDVVYFTGYEVEHTICHGKLTLFVVGTPPLDEILAKVADTGADHVYFGTSQSYHPSTDNYDLWDRVILGCLDENLWVTLDFDVRYTDIVHESGYSEHNRFVPMISVKLPYIGLFNYNATLKLDDTTWGKTNPGVWTHSLYSLMKKENFTHWDQYVEDDPV